LTLSSAGPGYLSDDWCGLKWSRWVKHKNFRNESALLPKFPGLYRVRVIDGDSLVYIGQTGRSVRQRQRELIVYLKDPEKMPFNDPHTAAPNLWAWADGKGFEFESSGAVFEGTKQDREGMEAYLLWQYRLEAGNSTQCNFGRFHEDYVKSRNKSSGFRGRKLIRGEKNPAGGPSAPPLRLKADGMPADPDWMGLNWSEPKVLNKENLKGIPGRPALYRIMNRKCSDVLYIGQTKSAKSRLMTHSEYDWEEEAFFSVYLFPDVSDPDSDSVISDFPTNESVLLYPHQIKEPENDLIGAYYGKFRRVPKFQIRK